MDCRQSQVQGEGEGRNLESDKEHRYLAKEDANAAPYSELRPNFA